MEKEENCDEFESCEKCKQITRSGANDDKVIFLRKYIGVVYAFVELIGLLIN